MSKAFSIRLLGPLEIRAGAHGTEPELGRKTRALLAYLATTRRPQRRQALADLFCQEANDPAGALRWHLSRLRRALGADVIRTEGERVQLVTRAGLMDLDQFEQVLDGDLTSWDNETLAATVTLYQGEFLAGLTLSHAPEFELWLLGERARLRRLYERGLVELVERFIALEQYETAIHWAQRLVQSDPLLEEAHARLIWLYAQTGRRQAALQQFEHCRDLLHRELAVQPTPELLALRAEVMAGHLGRSTSWHPPRVRFDAIVSQPAGFVGRGTELTQLQRAWQAAQQGRGAVVLVEAEAGGGKTRLVQEFAASVPGALFLSGRCHESTAVLPYRPWVDLLEAYQEGLDDAALHEVPRFWLDQLARLVPGLAQRLHSRSPGRLPITHDVGDRERLFAAVAEFTLGRPDSPPLLIFVDDLQWADEASLRLFHFLARRVRQAQAQALLVGAFRPEEAQDVPVLQTLTDDLRRDGLIHVRLAPLPQPAIAELMAQLWPQLPPGYRPHVCAMLIQATGGNPFFVTEVLRELAGTTDVPTSVPVPPNVRDLIRRRLRKLPESGRQVIEAIAVLDAPATLTLIQHVSGRSEEEVAMAVDLGLRWRLLHPQAESRPARYAFSHDLVREAVVGQMSDVRRRLLHRRAATALAETVAHLPATRRPEVVGQIAHHAVQGEAFALVLAWAPRAAGHAQEVGAYGEALALYEQALDALACQQEAGFHVAGARRQEATLLLHRVEMLHQLGRWSEEEALLQATAELLAGHADARLQARFHLRQAFYLVAVGRHAKALDVAQQAHQEHLDLGDEQGAAESLYVAGDCQMSLGRTRAARQLFERSLALFRAHGHANGEVRCLGAMAWSALNRGDVGATVAYLAQALETARQVGNRHTYARLCLLAGLAWASCCDAERVQHYAREALRLGQELGADGVVARARLLLAASHYLAGDLAQARGLYQEAFASAQAHRDSWLEGWAAQYLGRVALMDGELAAAERWLRQALELRSAHGEMQNLVSDLAWMGRLRLAQGRLADALALTTKAIEGLDALREDTYVWETPDVLMGHAEVLAAVGRQQEAAAYLQRAYDALMRFTTRLHDPQVRQGILTYPPNARIITAWQNGEISPYPGPS